MRIHYHSLFSLPLIALLQNRNNTLRRKIYTKNKRKKFNGTSMCRATVSYAEWNEERLRIKGNNLWSEAHIAKNDSLQAILSHCSWLPSRICLFGLARCSLNFPPPSIVVISKEEKKGKLILFYVLPRNSEIRERFAKLTLLW